VLPTTESQAQIGAVFRHFVLEKRHHNTRNLKSVCKNYEDYYKQLFSSKCEISKLGSFLKTCKCPMSI
jgi:hypothetical protein